MRKESKNSRFGIASWTATADLGDKIRKILPTRPIKPIGFDSNSKLWTLQQIDRSCQDTGNFVHKTLASAEEIESFLNAAKVDLSQIHFVVANLEGRGFEILAWANGTEVEAKYKIQAIPTTEKLGSIVAKKLDTGDFKLVGFNLDSTHLWMVERIHSD